MTDASPPTAAAETSGERFGDYVLVEKIAQGGMAELFLAKRRGVEGFEKTVAIKRILPELSWNREFVEMFINEAKIAARLSHPNIVQIFDFGKIDDYYFIAMEYVRGENLRALLQRSAEKDVPLSPDIVAFIVSRVCAGLEHAHRKTDEAGRPLRIVHRDVSPQNVLVSYDGDVKVVDFGIAKAVTENPEVTRGVLKGKLSYLSPEQVNGVGLDARTDVFAAGLVFYELLVGRKLFAKSDPAEVLDAIVHLDADAVARSVPNLDRGLREVLRRSLALDPEKRFGSAGEMETALESYLREHADAAGTTQVTKLMRLLFDKRISDRTGQMLREQLFGKPARAVRSTLGGSSPLRLMAALGGAVAGAIALVVAAPALRASTPSGAAKSTGRTEPSATNAPQGGGSTGASSSGLADAERASAALAANQAGEAIVGFEKAFAASPELRTRFGATYAKALTEEGRRLFDTDSDMAGQRFHAAIAADPDSFDAHFFLAKVYTRKSDPEAALREYQAAIRIDPRSADAQFNLGFVYFSQKRYEEARIQYEKVVELNPPYLADVFYNLSACYEQMKNKPEAVATLRRGLEAVPKSDLLRQRLRQLGG